MKIMLREHPCGSPIPSPAFTEPARAFEPQPNLSMILKVGVPEPTKLPKAAAASTKHRPRNPRLEPLLTLLQPDRSPKPVGMGSTARCLRRALSLFPFFRQTCHEERRSRICPVISPVVDAPESGDVAEAADSGLAVARHGHVKFANIQRIVAFHLKLWRFVFPTLVDPWTEYRASVEIHAGHDCCHDGRQMVFGHQRKKRLNEPFRRGPNTAPKTLQRVTKI